MNFRKHQTDDTPDINLIPFIDILLVILIFLMVSTTFSQYSELQISLPIATADNTSEHPQNINIMIDVTGQIAVNNHPVKFSSQDQFADFLKQQADRLSSNTPTVVITADHQATHQSVIHVLEAVKMAGFDRLAFATIKEQRELK